MMFKKDKGYERPTLTVIEKQELNIMRADIVCLEAMLREGVISVQEYNRKLEETSNRITALEQKYGIR